MLSSLVTVCVLCVYVLCVCVSWAVGYKYPAQAAVAAVNNNKYAHSAARLSQGY